MSLTIPDEILDRVAAKFRTLGDPTGWPSAAP
jgi:hypothetical protein